MVVENDRLPKKSPVILCLLLSFGPGPPFFLGDELPLTSVLPCCFEHGPAALEMSLSFLAESMPCLAGKKYR
jgi:hypothetical protein